MADQTTWAQSLMLRNKQWHRERRDSEKNLANSQIARARQFHYFSSSKSSSVRGNVAIREAFSWRCDSMLGQFDEKIVMPKSPRALRTIPWLFSQSPRKHQLRHVPEVNMKPFAMRTTNRTLQYVHENMRMGRFKHRFCSTDNEWCSDAPRRKPDWLARF